MSEVTIELKDESENDGEIRRGGLFDPIFVFLCFSSFFFIIIFYDK